MGALINALTVNIKEQGVFLLAALFIFLGGLIAIISNLQTYLSRWVFLALENTYSLLRLNKKGQLDVATLENPQNSDLINKITENGTWRCSNFTDRQFQILQEIIAVLVAGIIIFIYQWWLFPLIIIGLFPILFFEVKHGAVIWSIHDSNAEERRLFWELESHFNNTPSILELKLFQNIGYFVSLISKMLGSFIDKQKKQESRNLLKQILAIFINQLTVAIAICYFIFMVTQGVLQVGTLVFLITSIITLNQALSGLFKSTALQYQDSLFVSDFFEFLDLKSHIINPSKGLSLKLETPPEIIFDNVTFAYPNSNINVLENFSLSVQPGEKIALVGINGAGKTTLVKLLCRFYDPTSGRILINGKDLKEYDLEDWYSSMAVLFQQYANYNLKVKEGIALGRTSEPLNLEKVKHAAHLGGADDFIQNYPKKYNQMLGTQFTGGVEPSIGQRQKLALARSFYRDPAIYILDEPTSSVDAEAETKIFEKLEVLSKDKTVFLISHRFSTVRKAHKIVVIESGRIKESGTHEQLLDLNGTYHRLFHLQAKGYQ